MAMISALNEQLRRIVVAGTIRDELAAQFLEQMTAFEYADHTKPITVYIDTYGGSVDAALLMYDVIKTSSCPVNTVGMGKVMSAGVLLLAAGDKGHRYISRNTRVMIHEVSGGVHGTVSEMDNSLTESKRLQDTYVKLLSKDSGKTVTQLRKDMAKDNYMSAEASIKYGIADKILPSRRLKKKPVKKTTKKPAKKADTPKKTKGK